MGGIRLRGMGLGNCWDGTHECCPGASVGVRSEVIHRWRQKSEGSDFAVLLSPGVSAEPSVVSATSEQHTAHASLVSRGLLVRYKGQWLLLLLSDLSKQP